MCLAVLSAEAVVGERRLYKPKKPKVAIELAICTCCGKKFPIESLTNRLCSKCYCKEHRKQEEIEKAKKNMKAAEVEMELAFTALSTALPEKHCDIHKWKAEYAPVFGGDYYTEDVKAKYAENYMKALELQGKGLLKCTCADHQAHYLKCIDRCKEAKKKLEDAEKKVEELKNKGEQK